MTQSDLMPFNTSLNTTMMRIDSILLQTPLLETRLNTLNNTQLSTQAQLFCVDIRLNVTTDILDAIPSQISKFQMMLNAIAISELTNNSDLYHTVDTS